MHHLGAATLLLPFSVEGGLVRARRVAPTYTLPPAPDAPSADAYVLTLTAPRGLTLLRAAISLLLVGAGAVGYMSFQKEWSPGSTYPFDAGTTAVVGGALFFFGLMTTAFMAGLALLLFLFRLWYTTSIRADASGLLINATTGASTVAWDTIARVVVGVQGSRPRFYRVLGAEGKRLAGWGPHFSRKSTGEALAVTVTPDEMAALVARRAGITPEIVDVDQSPPRLGDQG